MSPLRTLRQLLAPTGRHRGRPEELEQRAALEQLLEETSPLEALLEESTLELLLEDGEVEANECAPCPTCARTTFQALHTDGSRTCWTCGTTTAGDQ
ncbi:hypothetical protein [Streptomyces sp. NPDC020607]|uniref:hypothetical protein n=1 Tax=Streptomyces sp. NPDC020607 TaxID=3365082 RepID=UPI0037B6220A